MKHSYTVLFLLIASLAFGQKKQELTPTKSIAKLVLNGKNEYVYYALSEKSILEYKVEGPGKLTLNFRARIDNDQFQSEPFKVRCVRSEKYIVSFKVPELLSSNLKFKSKSLEGSPTRLHKVEVIVPPGKHTYRFYKNKTNQKVNMRALYEKYPKPVWKAIKPTNQLDQKNLRYTKSGTIKSYYRITKQNGFDFEVKDSTFLKVFVRSEFSYNMLEETTLKIEFENLTNGTSKIYKLNSKKSDNIEFVDENKVIPGILNLFYVSLDKPLADKEKYRVRVLSGSKGAVIRLLNDINIK